MKRSVRLKEIEPNTVRALVPSDEYLRKTNGTIHKKEYITRTDSNGAIITGNEIEFTASHEDLILLGGSFVESSYVDETCRFAAVAERSLGGACKVFNYSYSGTTLFQSMLSFLSKVVGYHDPIKSKVMLFISYTDVDVLKLEGSYWNGSKRYAPILPALGEQRLSNHFQASDFRRVLKSFSDCLRNFGFDFTIVGSPYVSIDTMAEREFLISYFGNEIRANNKVRYRELLSSIAVDFAKDYGANYWNLHGVLGGRHELFYDHCHVNAVGSVAVGKAVADYYEKWC